MPIPKFDYFAPKNIEDAVNILKKNSKNSVVMAGGTDLLVKIRHRVISPKIIVSLKKIDNINKITFDKNTGITIGATVILSDIANHPSIIKHYPTIAAAAGSTANVQIRNMGTIIGNICNASPSADNAPTMLAMNSILTIFGPNGYRKLPLEKFYKGPGINSLRTGEIVLSIFIPIPNDNTGTAYFCFSQRGKVDCSAVGVGTMLILNENEKCTNIRLFIGACGPIPMRIPKAEKILKNKKITKKLIHTASLITSEEINPISDLRASAEYRRKIVAVMTNKALTNAKQMAIINKKYQLKK